MRASRIHTLPALLGLAFFWPLAFGPLASPAEEAETGKSAAQIAEESRPSLVAITHRSRADGGQREGSGFVIAPGLIATNLHVIGDARPIHVTTSDERELTVNTVHASDRKLDLAILRVDEDDLPALPLGDSTDLPDGHSVVVMGNPQGLRFSVVEGIISATRDFDGVDMIQLAIPIEPGNSGGPLLDRQGRVIGIPAMKSHLTDNIGFAIPVNALKLLLDKPNPIPMERWVTVGQLSPRKWKALQAGARWRQRAGTISVRGAGAGFGGRALCLFQTQPQKMPYEVAVKVKLDDEGGAAGLVFASDGGDRHYGFYPSGGQIRLTHFAGPDVFSWNILADRSVAAYRPGDWNHLRVVVDDETITGYVNGEEVVSLSHKALRGGQVGLCKFRQTEASFQQFSLNAPRDRIHEDPELKEHLEMALDQWLAAAAGKDEAEASKALLDENPKTARMLLQDKARALDRQAAALRRWAVNLHHAEVNREMAALLANREENEIDLVHAGLLIAKLANPDLDVDAYRRELDAMAEEIRATLAPDAGEKAILTQTSDYLFQQLGFHGSRLDYYSRENSYLNAVLEDREGLPITLSVLYLELAQRLGVKNVVGIPLPGHFVVQHRPEGGDEDTRQLIDVFDAGKPISLQEAETIVSNATGLTLEQRHIEPAGKKAILVRMLRNLINIDLNSGDATQALPRLDLLLTIAPAEASERLSRALLLYQANQWARALEDIEWILQEQPAGIHLDRVEELRRRIEAALEK